jgi:GTPase
MLIDDINIKLRAGHGGCGTVAFSKVLMTLGPTGGNGGDGGSVYLEGVSDIGALSYFRGRKELKAENGKNGRPQLHDGEDGKDIILKVPIGTLVHNLSTGEDSEIISIGQKLMIAKGGIGGKGNFKFRSSINTSPTQFQEGLPGEEYELRLELKLIADVGFVGLPNVGKSSLLNELTNAQSKVANYPFTTLDPNLGVYYELILADIPGIIEGASENKGLGIKFLRHIDRTKTLFHFISAESPNPEKDYKIIRNELRAYSKKLLDKAEYIFLSKCDLLDEDKIKQKLNQLKKINKKVIPISVLGNESIKQVEKILRDIIKEKYK